MFLKLLAFHAPLSALAYRTSIRMASTVVGKSGRVYVQGEILQRHREDQNLNVFKAEYVTSSITFSKLSNISDPSHLGPRMSLLSSSVSLGRSTICLYASQANLQTLVAFECTSIVTKRKVFYFIPISGTLYLLYFRKIQTFLLRNERKSCDV